MGPKGQTKCHSKMFHHRKCPKCKKFAFVSKTSRRSEESKVKKKCIFCTTREFICLNFSPHIRSYPSIICVFPTFRIKMFFPYFVSCITPLYLLSLFPSFRR